MINKDRFVPGVTDAGPPRAAKGGFPYPGHGSLASVAYREARAALGYDAAGRRGPYARRTA